MLHSKDYFPSWTESKCQFSLLFWETASQSWHFNAFFPSWFDDVCSINWSFRANESNVRINEKTYRHELLSYNVKRLVLTSPILKNQVNYLRTAILSTLSHTQYNFARARFIFNVQFNFEQWLRRRGYYCVVFTFPYIVLYPVKQIVFTAPIQALPRVLLFLLPHLCFW